MSAFSVSTLNECLDAVGKLCNGGTLCYFAGSQPASVDAPPKGRKLATLQLPNPAFAPAKAGVIIAGEIEPDVSAEATGKAGWWRIYGRDGRTAICDGTLGEDGDGAEITMGCRDIQEGCLVECSKFTINTNKP